MAGVGLRGEIDRLDVCWLSEFIQRLEVKGEELSSLRELWRSPRVRLAPAPT